MKIALEGSLTYFRILRNQQNRLEAHGHEVKIFWKEIWKEMPEYYYEQFMRFNPEEHLMIGDDYTEDWVTDMYQKSLEENL